MALIKTDASPELVEVLRRVEAQADECWRALQIVNDLSNVAVPECSPKLAIFGAIADLRHGALGMIARRIGFAELCDARDDDARCVRG